jgi:predicted GNAT family acetyltransferase
MKIEHNEQEKRGTFFIDEAGKKVAQMTYALEDGKMVIDHTMVDESIRGNDIGAQLVSEGVKYARDKGIKILPVCTYAKKVLEENKEYEDVLASY